jgi:4-amino-4-deoxy-L-arabinose transferase-like glycosyltransferase
MAGACLGFALWLVDLYRELQQGSRPPRPYSPPGKSPYEVLLLCVMTLLMIEKAVFVAREGFSFPSYFWDAVDTYNYRAKVLYFTGQLDLNPQSSTFLGGMNAHYPLGASLFRAWIATLLGGWSEKAILLDSMASYLLLFLLIWIGLSKKIGKRYGFLFAYLVVSLPLMVHHAYAGYTDLLLSLFFTGCLIYGYEYLTARDPLSGVVSLFFLISSLFTKNEGLVIVLPVMVSSMLFAIWQRRLYFRSTLLFLAVAILFALPWIILKAYFGLSFTTGRSHSVFELHLQGLSPLFSVVFRQGSFNLFGLFFILSVLFYFSTWWKTDLKLIALPIFLFLGAILGVFLFTRNYEFLEIQTAINRTLMVFMPPYIYLIGLSMDQQLNYELKRTS